MLNTEKLIRSIDEACKHLFQERFSITLFSQSYTSRTYRVQGNSKALNRFDFPFDSVGVLKWFDEFWFFIEVKFIRKQSDFSKNSFENITCISISAFQGQEQDDIKYQLFRAEWDDFGNHEEKHSQPHWHITADQAIEKTFEEYADTFENPDFLNVLKLEKEKIINMNKIHFAINGNWQNDDTHIHRIDSEEKVVKWLIGIITHLRTELESDY